MFESLKRVVLIKRSDITISRLLKALLRRFLSFPEMLYFYWPWGFPKKNRDRLKRFNNKYKGKRCFIVANGPSLNKIDFDLLKNEFTIGMNRIYLMKEQNDFMPSFLACIDKERLIEPFYKELDVLNTICFFPFTLRSFFNKKENQYFIGSRFSPKFQTDTSLPMGNGKTVTYTAIQLAYCMGFSEVYIVGKDHSFNTKGKAGVGIEVKGSDENHFIKNYFLPGQKWDLPDFETEEFAYRLSRTAFEKAGRTIKNATVGGKLEIFERIDFYSLFPKSI